MKDNTFSSEGCADEMVAASYENAQGAPLCDCDDRERFRIALETIIERARNDPDAQAYEFSAIAERALAALA